MNKSGILIVGGSGNVGSELLLLLANAGIHFRVLVRHKSTAQLPGHKNMETVYGDLDEAESIEIALRDIRQVFLLTHDQAQQGELEGKIIELAKQTGVEKIVKSSAFAAGLQPPVGYGITHAISEQKLMASGLKWAILRPYMFMQNFLELADLIMSRGLVPLPMGKAKIGLIDAKDVALVAKTILTEEGHENNIYELTGPDVLSLTECAEIFSSVLGRSIRYRSPPYWLAGLMMRMQGVSAWDVAMRRQLFRMIAEGGEARTTDDVKRTTGHKPRSLETFIREHQSTFQ